MDISRRSPGATLDPGIAASSVARTDQVFVQLAFPVLLPSYPRQSLPLLQNYAPICELCSVPFPGLVKKKKKEKKEEKGERKKRRARKSVALVGLGYFHPRATNRDPRGAPSPPRRANDLFQRPLGFDINDFSGPQGETHPRVTLPANFSPSTLFPSSPPPPLLERTIFGGREVAPRVRL